MSDQPHAADDESQAIDRIERALDRIAALVREIDAEPPDPSAEELRARLDRLVMTLRTTLAVSGNAGGG